MCMFVCMCMYVAVYVHTCSVCMYIYIVWVCVYVCVCGGGCIIMTVANSLIQVIAQTIIMETDPIMTELTLYNSL